MADLTTEDILGFAATIVDTPAKAHRRDLAMERAHAKGLSGCEICGRALEPGAGVRVNKDTRVGMTCARKMARAGMITLPKAKPSKKKPTPQSLRSSIRRDT